MMLWTLKREVGEEVNWETIDKLGRIGLDEVAHKKGHKSYRAIITARQDNGDVVILAVLENRKKRVSTIFS